MWAVGKLFSELLEVASFFTYVLYLLEAAIVVVDSTFNVSSPFSFHLILQHRY